MSRRSLAGALAIVALLLTSLGGVVTAMLRYEPHHHRRAELPPGKERAEQSQEFVKEFTGMIGEARLQISGVQGQDRWSQDFTFTDEQINSFLAEGFVQQGWADKLLPEGISEPRVCFEQDVMHLSFRYKTKVLSTVVSIGMKAWVAPSEGNVLALRMEGFHAGAVPFKAQWLLDRLSDVARQHEVEVSWYRHEGRPVAILRFQPNQPRPSIKLKQVLVEQGKLTVSGESGPQRRTAVSLLPPGLAPLLAPAP
jgi:hypothetical protein